MSTVDDRVVKMTFDNVAFEKAIAETIKSIETLEKSLNFSTVKQSMPATIQSVDKLKQALKFEEAAKSVKGISSAAEAPKSEMDKLSGSVKGVSAGFIAMSAVAVSAIATLTNTAVQAGTRIARGFFGVITDGFHEFELNMNSVQTIMANTASQGTNLQQVNDALDEMNAFSDKTIFNFGEMARNMGTFTAAGVDLKTSAASIKGIANLAALSGSSSEQAASAMYQLSQAIATGSLKLIDWNSVVNAGMGGEVFKNALFETGKALGKLGDIPMNQTFKEWTDAGHNFRDSLQDGWVTAEVLTTTLKGFTGDLNLDELKKLGFTDEQAQQMIKMAQIASDAATKVKTFTQLIQVTKESIGSGWSQSFRTMIGDFEESKTLWTGYNQIIGAFIQRTSDARNQLLANFKAIGGRDELFATINETFKQLWSVIRPIHDAFRDIFPPVTAQRLLEIVQALHAFIQRMGQTLTTSTKMREIFGGVFAALEIIWHVVKGVVGVFTDLAGSFNPVNNKFGEFLVKIAQFVKGLNVALIEGGGLKRFFETLTGILQNIFNFIGKILSPLGKLRDILIGFFSNLSFDDISAGVDKVQAGFSKFAEILQNLQSLIVDIFSKIPFAKLGAGIDNIKDKFAGMFGGLGKDSGIQESIGQIGRLKDSTKDLFVSVSKSKNLEQLQISLATFRTTFVNAFNPTGTADWRDKVMQSLGLVKGGMDDGTGAMDNFKNSFSKVGDVFDTNLQLSEKFRQTLALFSDAFKNSTESSSKFNDIWTSISDKISGVNQTASETPGFLERLGSSIQGFFEKVFDALKALFTAENWDRLLKTMGLGIGLGLTRVLTNLTDDKTKLKIFDKIMAPFRKFLGGLQDAVKTWERGKQIEALRNLAVAIAILAGALIVLSLIDPGKLGVALGAITVGLLAMVGAMKIMNKEFGVGGKETGIKGVVGGAKDAIGVEAMASALILIASAMLVLAFAFQKFGTMDPEVLKQGGIALAAALSSLIFMMHALPDQKDMIGFGVSLIAISVALLILFRSIEKYGKAFSGKRGDTMLAGTIAIAGVVAILGLALRTFPDKGEVIEMAGALLIMSVAVILIGKAITMVGKLGIGSIIASTLSLVVLIAALAIVMDTLSLIKDPMKGVTAFAAMAASLLVIAAAVKLIGEMSGGDIAQGVGVLIGFILVFAGLVIAITATADVALPAIESLSHAFLMFGGALALMGLGVLLAAKAIKMLSTIDKKGLERLKDSLITIGEAIPLLVAGFFKGIIEGVREVINAIPAFLKDLGVSLDSFIAFVREYVPKFIELGLDMINGFMQKVRDHAAEFSQLGAEIVSEFFRGLSEVNPLTGIAPIDDMINRLTDFLVLVFNAIRDNTGPIVDAFVGMLTALFNALANNAEKVMASFTKMQVAFIHGLTNHVAELATAWIGFLVEVIDAVALRVPELMVSIAKLVDAIVFGLISLSWKFIQAGVTLITQVLIGMASGILQVSENVGEIIRNFLDAMTKVVKENAVPIAEKFEELGKAIAEGIGAGIKATNPVSFIGAFIDGLLGKGEKHAGANSPATMFMPLGASIAQGVALGMTQDNSIESSIGGMTDTMVTAFQSTLSRIPAELNELDEFQPKITPVLDLTGVQKDAQGISSALGTSPLSVDLSRSQAASIASMTSRIPEAAAPETSQPSQIVFEQNIHAPTQLSTVDIYRQTKGQIALAKEQLRL